MVHSLLKLVHIFLAILAVGSNATYGIWLARARDDRAQLSFALRGIKFLDDRVANPAYGLLLITGLLLVLSDQIPLLQTRWILSALVLFAVLVVLGFGFYTPALARQIRVLESEGPQSPAYRRLRGRSTIIGIGTLVVVLAILFLMVVKPTI